MLRRSVSSAVEAMVTTAVGDCDGRSRAKSPTAKKAKGRRPPRRKWTQYWCVCENFITHWMSGKRDIEVQFSLW